MIAVDVTPLALGERRGVARALHHALEGLRRVPPSLPVRLFSPGPLPSDVPTLDGVVRPPRAVTSARAFRRRLPALLAAEGARVLYVPWSAFPRTPVPVVATIHELPFVRHGPIEGRLRTRVHRTWLKRGARRAAGLVVPSEATRQDVLAACRIEPSRVHLVPNGFDPAPWREAAEAPRPHAPPFVLMVGTGPRPWGPRKKGLDVLVEAMRRLDPAGVHLVVVGEVEGPLPARVRLHPRPDEAALLRLVASARVLVHPARSEGFGFPPLEAMAAGVPVVASRAGSLPEVVGEAALLVPPGDPAELAVALETALFDEEVRARLLAAGRVRADAFAPEEAGRRLGRLLETVGAGP